MSRYRIVYRDAAFGDMQPDEHIEGGRLELKDGFAVISHRGATAAIVPLTNVLLIAQEIEETE